MIYALQRQSEVTEEIKEKFLDFLYVLVQILTNTALFLLVCFIDILFRHKSEGLLFPDILGIYSLRVVVQAADAYLIAKFIRRGVIGCWKATWGK